MSASHDDSESVDQFLARIASLSNKKDDEDADRARKMEEDMLQARKERQARRAERARSISPVKTGPAAPSSNSPRVGASPRERSIEPPLVLTPPPQTQTPSRTGPSPRQSIYEPINPSASPEPVRQLPQPPLFESPSNPSHPPNATTLSRSGNLSWQQRPSSRGLGSVRGRPFSASRSPVRTLPEPPKTTDADREELELSRQDIAASLSSRDPAWFRQTQDRGIGSAAYRKTSNQESSNDSPAHKAMKLPGMASEVSNMTAASSPKQTEDTKPRDVPKSWGNRGSQQTQSRDQPSASPSLAASSLTDTPFSKPSELNDAAEADNMLSRSSSILAAGRSPSPTKGLGGFVQSAMMRRSDSVSKRWSVQANAGLKRGDSIASNRPIFSPPVTTPAALGHARNLSREPRALRDGTSSPLSGSRPSSSHDQPFQDRPSSQMGRPESQVFTTPKPLSEKSSPTLPQDRPKTPPPSVPSLSRSPSKTLDPRRWSPAKASWLESALQKPESPRPTTSKPETPAWKVDMQRSKDQKDLQESPKRPVSSFDPPSTGGLLRSPPAGSDDKPPPLFRDLLSKQTRPTSESSSADFKIVAELDPATLSKSGEAALATRSDRPAVSKALLKDQEIGKEPVTIDPSAVQKLLPKSDLNTTPDFSKSLDKQPPVLKPKPQTPPKTDFRANLKSRQTASTDSGNNEPEFKAVFGKLKRTQTQNYVAPDVLKTNITRGKAGLNVTGGPQQTKRVDEFKESILQKKEAIKQSSSAGHKSVGSNTQEKSAQDVPEALARRNTLHKAKPSTDASLIKPSSTMPRAIPEKPATKPDKLSARRQDTRSAPAPAPMKTLEPTVSKSKVDEVPNESVTATAILKSATEVVQGSPPLTKTMSKSPEPERSPSPKKDTIGVKLAARLNPALASLITRGNSPKPQEESIQHRSTRSDLESSTTSTSRAERADDGSGYLQHMTKDRARGPRRRAPKAEAKMESDNPPPTQVSKIVAAVAAPAPNQSQRPAVPSWNAKSAPAPSSASPAIPLQKSSAKIEVPPSSPAREVESSSGVDQPLSRFSSQDNTGVKVRPAIASKSPELRRVSNVASATEPKEERSLPKPAMAGKAFDIATDKTSQNTSAAATAPAREPAQVQDARPLPLTPSRNKMNSPTKSADSPSTDPHISKLKTKPAGLGLNLNSSAKKSVAADILTPPSDSDLTVPSRKAIRSTRAESGTSVSKTIHTFFGTVPRTADRVEFDTETYLAAQTSHIPRVQTISKQIWEVNGDGKRTALPPGQEHILYEECMYLCVHVFENEKSSKLAEAYLWAGDAVPDAAIEDAQLFCKKVARENSAKMEVVKQGKESSNFFSALGGIAIIRKTKSSALYMLCGRRHHGHVAFDEVEMSAANLCSGFSFLISARFGKLYLWKGQGSGVDENSAAKLISMDLSLTGEIEEVSEGSEPSSFWENIPDRKAFQTSDMWSMRSMDQQKGFPCRLYRVEPERPKSSGGFWGLRATSPPKPSNKVALQEISPFSQQDLDPSSVHILDAYANIYILPGSSATPKPAEFVSALHIAQEIAVLAPSVEDRSLLPSCEVVFGEPPRDFRAAFRKWTPGLNVDTSKERACVDLAEVLRVLG